MNPLDHQYTRYGAITQLLPTTPGKTFFVINKDHPAYTSFTLSYPPDVDGYQRVFTDVQSAVDATVSGREDVIVIVGGIYESNDMITIDKTDLTITSIDFINGINTDALCALVLVGAKAGQTATLKLGANSARVKVTGIAILNENTHANSLNALDVDGAGHYFQNCTVSLEDKFDTATASDIILAGSGHKLVDCIVGTDNSAVSGAIVRACIRVTGSLSGLVLEGCTLLRRTGNAANRFIQAESGSTITGINILKDCIIAGFGTAVGMAITLAGTVTGVFLVKNSTTTGASKVSTSTGVLVDGGAPDAGTTGIAVQAT